MHDRCRDERLTAAPALVAAAIGVGAIHTLAPDHWMPFAALSRAEGWSARRTALVTAGCGLGHVTSSVALGLTSAYLGLELVSRFGDRVERVSGFLLIAFGVVYAAYGLHRRLAHAHRHDHAAPRSLTPWTLFVLFAADPCVAVIPLMFASLPLGVPTVLAVVLGYEAATIATMVALVLPARAAAATIHSPWIDHWGQALAGSLVAIVGVIVVGLGV